MLGENAYREGRLTEAEHEFLACLDLHPGFSPALIGAARAYHADHQNDKVKPLLQLALKDDPHNFLASYALGVVANEEQRYGEAETYFQAAIRDRPNFAQAHQGLGMAQVDNREFAAAVRSLERARTLGSANPVLLTYEGLALSHVGDMRRAIDLYLQALDLKPDYDVARLNLALAYQKTARREEARRQYEILCNSGSELCGRFREAFRSQ
jgi:tetratricopeptide (TPR) repeat protein